MPNLNKLGVKYSDEDFELPKTRASELPNIKLQRRAFLKSLIGREDVEGAEYFGLSVSQFLIFSLLQYTTAHQLTQLFEEAFNKGAQSMLYFFIAFQVIFGLPIHMLVTFLASYTKRSFIRIWQCVPAFEGLGYSMAMARLLFEAPNVSIVAHCVRVCFEVIAHKRATMAEVCATAAPPLDRALECVAAPLAVNETCVVNRTASVVFATTTQYYFLTVMLDGAHSGLFKCCSFLLDDAIAMTCLWAVIFVVAIFGTGRVLSILSKLCAGAGILLLVTVAYVLIVVERDPVEIFPPWSTSVYSIAIMIGDQILKTNNPVFLTNAFWLGTMLPKRLTPVSASLWFFGIKLMASFVLYGMYAMILRGLFSHFNIPDPLCSYTRGIEVFLAFVPDLLTDLYLGYALTIAWYLCLVVVFLASPICCVLSIVDSVCESRPQLNRVRIALYVPVCLVGLLFSMPYAMNINDALLGFFDQFSMVALRAALLTLVNVCLVFVYSIARVIEDYSFTYGVEPHSYWVFFWHSIPIISFYSFIYLLRDFNAALNEGFTTPGIAGYCVIFYVLAPVPTVALLKFFKQLKYHTLRQLLKPSDTWGPYDRGKLYARQMYFPRRDVKYRTTTLRCSHKCLVDASSYSQEHSRQMTMLHKLVKANKALLPYDFIDAIIKQD